MANAEKTIVIAGAGSIGCYVGGCLALAGRKVVFLARPRIAEALLGGGLRVTDLDGRDRSIKPVSVTAEPAAALANADVVLVTVKNGATEEMAALIAAHASSDVVVVSLQNGVGNADRLRAGLGSRPVLAGMVPFNVVQSAEGDVPLHVHRASEGKVMIEEGTAGLAGLLDVEGLAVETHADIKAVQWGKLLINLNNALVALSGLPLASELADRRWRLILAGQIDDGGDEGLGHCAGADRRPASRPAAETAPAAGLAVPAGGAAHARHRPAGALVDVGRSPARPANRDRRPAGNGPEPRRKGRHAGAFAEAGHRAGAAGRAGKARVTRADAGSRHGIGCSPRASGLGPHMGRE